MAEFGKQQEKLYKERQEAAAKREAELKAAQETKKI